MTRRVPLDLVLIFPSWVWRLWRWWIARAIESWKWLPVSFWLYSWILMIRPWNNWLIVFFCKPRTWSLPTILEYCVHLFYHLGSFDGSTFGNHMELLIIGIEFSYCSSSTPHRENILLCSNCTYIMAISHCIESWAGRAYRFEFYNRINAYEL